METTVSIERVDEDSEFLPSQEILRENLTKRTRKKPAKLFTEHKCGQCGKILSDKFSLRNHIQTHSTACPFQCRQCPYKGKTRKYLQRHVNRAHREPTALVSCKYCDKTFRFKSKMKVHERVHTGEKPYKCDVCGKAFNSAYSLATHNFIHTDEKPFKCSFCEYACRDSSTLRKHQERHMGIKRYQCELCPKRYDFKTRLAAHVREIHTAPELREHACSRCNSAFKDKRVLRRHIEVVHDRKRACECSVCGKYIPDSHNLPAHMRTHVDAKPYACAFQGCTVRFRDKSDLKRHAVIHNPAKQVTCDHCGHSFSRKHHLMKHILKMHDRPNTKSERCEFCGVCFLTKNYLSKHIKMKHARKRQKFICDMCDFETHNKPSIVMHIKHGHNHSNKTECTICGKTYKRRSALKLHYKSSHDVHFKTKSRTLPKIQIKEEPLDPIPDLEIDLLDIDKEEPFTAFETEYSEDISKIYQPNEEKDQRLQDLFRKMIHDPEYELDGTHESTDNITEAENRIDEPPHNTSLPVEKLIQQDRNEEEMKSDENELTESKNNLTEAQSEESPKNTTNETQPEGITESPNMTEAGNRTEDAQEPMPVEQFIQQVVGDVDDTPDIEEPYKLDRESHEFLKRRIKELIMQQRRADNIRRLDYGPRTLKRKQKF
ncbi:hypothetical protein ABMA27_012196 [Loxostege sticticalis]|uniref:C2H2-type domain-containing protein n=1 Tax=Loxostege sticticalis TaxID=481309 RepID=A0ABR3H0G6_LOXSC